MMISLQCRNLIAQCVRFPCWHQCVVAKSPLKLCPHNLNGALMVQFLLVVVHWETLRMRKALLMWIVSSIVGRPFKLAERKIARRSLTKVLRLFFSADTSKTLVWQHTSCWWEIFGAPNCDLLSSCSPHSCWEVVCSASWNGFFFLLPLLLLLIAPATLSLFVAYLTSWTGDDVFLFHDQTCCDMRQSDLLDGLLSQLVR